MSIARQAQNTDDESLNAFIGHLRTQIDGPLPEALAKAKIHRVWAKAARIAGDLDEARKLEKRAEYFELCHRHGIPTES